MPTEQSPVTGHVEQDHPDKAARLQYSTPADDLDEVNPSQSLTTASVYPEIGSNNQAIDSGHDHSHTEPPTSHQGAQPMEPHFETFNYNPGYPTSINPGAELDSLYGLPPSVSSYRYTPFQPMLSSQRLQALASLGLQTHEMNTRLDLVLNTLPIGTSQAEAEESNETPTRKPRSAPSDRTRQFNERMAAVNGVVIPSKVPPGTMPRQIKSRARSGAPLIHECTICKSRFGKIYHVQSHFPSCAERYGNPAGAKWDDGVYRKRVRKRRPRKGIVEDNEEGLDSEHEEHDIIPTDANVDYGGEWRGTESRGQEGGAVLQGEQGASEDDAAMFDRENSVEEREYTVWHREAAVGEWEQALSRREDALQAREQAVAARERAFGGWREASEVYSGFFNARLRSRSPASEYRVD